MNEKIKEFAEQAWPGLPSHWWDRRDGEVAEAVNKFAELIVRECYRVCKDNLVPLSEYDSDEAFKYNEGVADCAIMIKRHFGVEL